MRWFKVAAIAAGILIGFLVVGSVIGAIFHILTQLVLAALVVGAVVVAVKVARSRRQVWAPRPSAKCMTAITSSTAGRCPGPTSSLRRRRIRPGPHGPQGPQAPPSPPPTTWTTSWPGSSARWAAYRLVP